MEILFLTAKSIIFLKIDQSMIQEPFGIFEKLFSPLLVIHFSSN